LYNLDESDFGVAMTYRILFTFCIVLFLTGSCGSTTEKGGDHVPTDKTYSVLDLPKGSEFRTIVPTEYNTNLLARFVHIAETYRICFDKDQFVEGDIESFQNFVSNRSSAVNQYGIEGIINYTFATLQAFDPEKALFSSRVSIQLIWSDTSSCDFVIQFADQTSFPFNTTDFSGKKRVLLGAGQLITPSQQSSKIPVGYFVRSTNSDDLVHMQKLIASYLGFTDSSNESSYLFSKSDASTAETWNVVNANDQILVGDDSLRIYTFAAAWQNVLKPQDLDRFHYYDDVFGKGNVAIDPLLSIESIAEVPTFLDLPGNKFLIGARRLQDNLNVCFANDSGLVITKELVMDWTRFMTVTDSAGVHGKLHAIEPTFTPVGTVVTSNCQLFISFRNESQYPFVSSKANGFYAHEGTVKISDGTLTKIPVIYVNASNLSLSVLPDPTMAARHVSTVLQHEYAHFLGFRHSQQAASLQSPAGNGSGWVSADDGFFQEYLRYWVK